MLKIYNETSNIEFNRIKSNSTASFSHMDFFMRIFFFTEEKRLEELFYLERGGPVKDTFLNKGQRVSEGFRAAMPSDSRWEIIINGYKRLLSIMRENKYFKGIIAPKIGEIENIIKKGKNFIDIKDFFFEMAMYVAGVSRPDKFQHHHKTKFFPLTTRRNNYYTE
jgi:hypothetical protein